MSRGRAVDPSQSKLRSDIPSNWVCENRALQICDLSSVDRKLPNSD